MINLEKPVLFVSDIDGTLLKNRYQVADSTKNVINRALRYKQGSIFKFALATGRPLHETKATIKELELTEKEVYIVCCNGAVVKDFRDKSNNISYSFFDKKIVKRITSIYEKYKKETKYSNYSSLDKSMKSNNSRLGSAYESWIKYSVEYIESMEEIIEHDVCKISTFSLRKSDSQTLFEALKKELNDEVTLLQTRGRFIEIMPKGTNKLNGIKILQQYLKIEDDQVIVVGDNINDIEMLEYYKNSYAVKNSHESALSAAKTVLPHKNNDNAIANLILELMN